MKKAKIGLFTLLIIYVCIFFYRSQSIENVEQNSPLSQSSEAHWLKYLKGVKELKRIWSTGDYPNIDEISCENFHWPSLKKFVGTEYLKCNGLAFQCFLSDLKKNFNSEFEFYHLEKKEIIKIGEKSRLLGKFRGYFLDTSQGDIQKSLIFENKCQEVYLPKGEYIFSPLNYGLDIGTKKREVSENWENKKNIFIDKFQVTHFDLYTSKNDKFKKLIDFKRLFRPVTQLSFLEMKEYCESIDKKLLTAKLYDAMNLQGKRIKELLVESNGSECLDFYHRDCFVKKEKMFYLSTDNVSQIGTYDIRGGAFEAVQNDEHPFFNLIASSMYFGPKSYWHNITHRTHWDGLGHKRKNFNFISSITGEYLESINGKNLKVGFRCYRDL